MFRPLIQIKTLSWRSQWWPNSWSTGASCSKKKIVPCPFVLQRFKKAPAVGAFNISSTNGHFTVVHEVGGV